jgi:hypothetical protein
LTGDVTAAAGNNATTVDPVAISGKPLLGALTGTQEALVNDAGVLRRVVLGTIAGQAANNVSITGGSVTGITDLAVADGGTGASTAPLALTSLGAVAKAGDTMTGTLNLPSNGLTVGTDQLVVSGTNIGIGIATPAYKQHTIQNKNTTGLFLVSLNPFGIGDYTEIGFGASFLGSLVLGAIRHAFDNPTLSGDSSIQFRTFGSGSTTEKLRISANGQVGIGETSPVAQLHAKSATAARIAQIIQLAVSQTADALQVQSSTGTVLMDVDAAGVVQAAGYKSSDGSAGMTTNYVVAVGDTLHIKNGLITSITPA